MGPIVLFDKSFLQSLSANEAVWFDHYFIASIAPMFFVETLADLEKDMAGGRTREQEVAIIARKTPAMSGVPCAHHRTLSTSNLLGYPVPVTGQVPVAGGRNVRVAGELATVFQEAPEAAAFLRWQREEYSEVERQFARYWRQELREFSYRSLLDQCRALGLAVPTYGSLVAAREASEAMLADLARSSDGMHIALNILGVPERFRDRVLDRWSSMNESSPRVFAPYAAHVLAVDLFFMLAVASKLIEGDPAHTRVDMAYLYYLPFCMCFVSSDKIHRRCAPLFLREDQRFVEGRELKASLGELQSHFSAMSEQERRRGLTAISHNPPDGIAPVVTSLWDNHLPGWRNMSTEGRKQDPQGDRTTVGRVNALMEAAERGADDEPYQAESVDSVVVQRIVPRKRGDWWLVPWDLKD